MVIDMTVFASYGGMVSHIEHFGWPETGWEAQVDGEDRSIVYRVGEGRVLYAARYEPAEGYSVFRITARLWTNQPEHAYPIIARTERDARRIFSSAIPWMDLTRVERLEGREADDALMVDANRRMR